MFPNSWFTRSWWPDSWFPKTGAERTGRPAAVGGKRLALTLLDYVNKRSLLDEIEAKNFALLKQRVAENRRQFERERAKVQAASLMYAVLLAEV